MSEYETYYREVACNSTTWAVPDADRCGCRGTGWWVSEVDTYHECPFHYDGQPGPDCTEADWEAYEAAKEAEEADAAAPVDNFPGIDRMGQAIHPAGDHFGPDEDDIPF